MLKGKELGNAIGKAIQLKLDYSKAKSRTEIARHFGVKLPSIYDWIKKGAISKDKLPELWNYFSDVVGMDHWGIEENKLNFDPTNINNINIKKDVFEELDGNPVEIKNLLLFNEKSSSVEDVNFIRSFNSLNREEKDELIETFIKLKQKKLKEKQNKTK